MTTGSCLLELQSSGSMAVLLPRLTSLAGPGAGLHKSTFILDVINLLSASRAGLFPVHCTALTCLLHC